MEGSETFVVSALDLRRQKPRHLGIKRHGGSMFGQHVGPVRGTKRPKRACEAPAAVRRAGCRCFGQRLPVQADKAVVEVKFHETVMVNGIGVGGGHRCARREVIVMDRRHQPGMVDTIDGAGFIHEALGELWVLGILRVKDLDGYMALDRLMHSFENDAHPAFPELAEHSVLADQ